MFRFVSGIFSISMQPSSSFIQQSSSSFTQQPSSSTQQPSSSSSSSYSYLLENAIVVYDPSRKFSCTGLNALRFALFKASSVNDLRRIPPTEDAFFQHCLRCCYQAGWIWGSTLNKNVGPSSTSVCNWIWMGIHWILSHPQMEDTSQHWLQQNFFCILFMQRKVFEMQVSKS